MQDEIEDRVQWLAYIVSNFYAMMMVYAVHGIEDAQMADHEVLEAEIAIQRESMMPAIRRRAEVWITQLDESFFKNAKQKN